jgi:hypothetical protein
MLPRNKLRTTLVSKTNTIASYLLKITKLCNQLAVVGEKVKNKSYYLQLGMVFHLLVCLLFEVSVPKSNILPLRSYGMISSRRR